MRKSFEDDLRMMVFSSSNQLYAIPLLEVREVIANQSLTPVAFSPEAFSGILNLRGNVVSVLDFQLRLEGKPTVPNPESSIVILDNSDQAIGILVDSVEFVCELDPASITSPEKIGESAGAEHISAVAHHRERIIQIIDSQKIVHLRTKSPSFANDAAS